MVKEQGLFNDYSRHFRKKIYCGVAKSKGKLSKLKSKNGRIHIAYQKCKSHQKP